MNYTQEQTIYIVEKYLENPTRETVEKLAEELQKTSKSIIGKLSREGVYRRSVYKTKTGESPETKEQLVREIESALDLEIEILAGLEKAPKLVLKHLRNSL